ncbi:MAG: hypothetical protein IPM25_04515 [Chloracidobacterium sp.]|nr:hypothetical protein [Chloracidobacterium sp.]
MSTELILLQTAPSGAVIGAVVAAAFFLMFLGIAYVAYKALRKTVTLAVRAMIVAAILAIAVGGSLTLWYYSSSGAPKMKPPAERRR